MSNVTVSTKLASVQSYPSNYFRVRHPCRWFGWFLYGGVTRWCYNSEASIHSVASLLGTQIQFDSIPLSREVFQTFSAFTWHSRKPNYWVSLTVHVYTLVCLKLDRIGFLTVRLKHLDYSIDSRITCACIRSIRLDSDFAFCAGSRFFSPGRGLEIEGDGGVFPPKSLQARAPLCI